jgi:exoribonuclease R
LEPPPTAEAKNARNPITTIIVQKVISHSTWANRKMNRAILNAFLLVAVGPTKKENTAEPSAQVLKCLRHQLHIVLAAYTPRKGEISSKARMKLDNSSASIDL